VLSIQAPFAVPTQDRLAAVLTPKGVTVTGTLIYDKDKTSYRSEIDEALKTKPDLLYLNGYAPDVGVILRDLYRADYTGTKLTQSYALTDKSLQQLPKPITEGAITVQPSADVNSPAYAAEIKRLGLPAPDNYESAATDWISIVCLTIARAGQATGTAIRDTVRQITNSEGEIVYTAVAGLPKIKPGTTIKYSGASGPCTFTDIGDIIDCKFRFNQVKDGAFTLLEVA